LNKGVLEMKLVVKLPGFERDPIQYEEIDYAIGAVGELDILAENGYVIATYAPGAWESVTRMLDENENWPTPPPASPVVAGFGAASAPVPATLAPERSGRR
jgi:hypothetical protein